MESLPVSLHDDGGAQVFILVPPVARTRRAAARAQNALIHAVLRNTIAQQLPVTSTRQQFTTRCVLIQYLMYTIPER